jgi:hypothetical protein
MVVRRNGERYGGECVTGTNEKGKLNGAKVRYGGMKKDKGRGCRRNLMPKGGMKVRMKKEINALIRMR